MLAFFSLSTGFCFLQEKDAFSEYEKGKKHKNSIGVQEFYLWIYR